MWRMADGDRVLTDVEWALFCEGVDLLRDSIEDSLRNQSDETETGVLVFDRLTPEQQLVLLADTAQALRDQSIPMPPHSAVNEGAIAAVLTIIRESLDLELELAGDASEDAMPTECRKLLRAVGEDSESLDDPLPSESSCAIEEWDSLLEEFRWRIFWDTDYEMGDEFLDLPPDEAREKLGCFGIDPEYFLTVPVEPDKACLIGARQKLAKLLGLPVPDDDGLYSALDDLYHGLEIGPCSSVEVEAWQDNAWVQVVGMTEPGWDCDYATWSANFSQALPTTPFQVLPDTAEGLGELPNDLNIERKDEAWVVRDEHGWYWCGLVECGWSGNPDDDEFPILKFATEDEAKSAYAQANLMYLERANRRKQALAKLGYPEE